MDFNKVIVGVSTLTIGIGGVVVIGGKMKRLVKRRTWIKKPKVADLRYPGARQNEVNLQQDFIVNEVKKEYEKLLEVLQRTLELDKEINFSFEEELRNCFIAWDELEQLKYEEKKAEIVLNAFYANGKIRSKLQDFIEYVKNDLSEEEDVNTVVVCGFNSCMNLAWIDYKKMNSRLNEVIPEKKESERVVGFLNELSYKNSAFEALYRAYLLGTDKSKGNTIACSDLELYQLLRKINRKINNYCQEKDEFDFEKIVEGLKQRKKRIENSILEAKNLKESLDELMAESIMIKMKDKTCEVDLLKKQYYNIAEEVKKILMDVKY